MIRRLICTFTLLCALLATRAMAAHIAGAELVYSCQGNNIYHIKLKLYRDCAGGGAGFDDPLQLHIFRGDGMLYNIYDIAVPWSTPQVLPENWNACVGTPYTFCVEEGTYEIDVQLPPFPSGYNIAWTRCCRNNIITNLAAPECEGITFLAHIPGPAAASCNSMPVFNNTPSLFLCVGETYYFDYSATDADGDSLVYSLSHPFTGENFQGLGTGNSTGSCGTTLTPSITPTNPMGPPPYQGVVFSPGHSAQNPFGPGGHATINPNTGYLEAYPASTGVFVLAVSVREYRNGVLLSENKRDFQFHVITCLPQNPAPTVSHDLSGLTTNGDTIIVEAGRSFCYTFEVEDPIQPSLIAVTPLSVSFGGNGGFPPPYATIQLSGPNPPVTGTICWEPSCDYVGDVVPMIISARDLNDCPNYNLVFDTVWVRVMPPVIAPPVLSTNTGTLPVVNDTIIMAVQENFCFTFTVVDTLGTGSLVGQVLLQDTLGNMLGQTHSLTTNTVGDTLFGTICWQTYCNFGFVYMFVINGIDEFQCPPNNLSSDTIYVRVAYPSNPAPQTDIDISLNTTQGDTILANVGEGFCFYFTVQDTAFDAGQSVSFDVTILDGNGGTVVNNPVSYSVFGDNDSIGGQICWTPNCDNVDQLITLLIRGDQENACLQHSYDVDTVYVRVTEPFKPKPLISHDLGPNGIGNTELLVADDETFCFTFQLVDTVSPTHVVYDIDVFYANGQPYLGSGPTLTYTTQQDSLLEGEICWTVPCELASQRFMISMSGRDTFDCRLSNMVFDTVYISHTDNVPGQLTFCNATVGDDDASVTLTWVGSSESDVRYYRVWRQRDDAAALTLLDSMVLATDTTYIDAQGVDADGHFYIYAIDAADRCGNVSPLSNQIHTMRLQAAALDYTSQLEWSPILGWDGVLVNYDIWRGAPIVNGFPSGPWETVSPNVLSLLDDEASRARLCYRVYAISDGSGCADVSQSNEACVSFPPTLFMPTGFTPNGDGLNDVFNSFGEFVESYSLEVYDRWGKLIFRGSDPYQGWDGTIDGLAAAEGTYVFKVEAVGYNGEVLRKEGSVTLIR